MSIKGSFGLYSASTRIQSTNQISDPMRQYYKIWYTVKLKGSCVVEHHPNFFARLKKAVVKEKDMDTGFKLQCEEADKRTKLKVTQVVSKYGNPALRFELIYSLGPEDL